MRLDGPKFLNQGWFYAGGMCSSGVSMIPNNIGEDPHGAFIGPIGSVAPWSIVQNGSSGGANTGASTATAQPIHAGLLTTRCCARFVCSDNRLVSSKLRLS